MADTGSKGRKELKLDRNDFQVNEKGELVIDKHTLDQAMQGTPAESTSPEAEAVKVGIVIEF
ncbi:MAG TPA: hypothetical protein VFZ66_21390 [Herpetosiphonaceae bacterium]